MADGFLGRWSRRKLDAKEGKAVPEEAPRPEPPPPQPSSSGRASLPAATDGASVAADPAQEPEAPPPTLEDVRSLTPESDFRRFVRPDVTPEVRNSALKKLFADPRFNVQDGLDVYIDDYSRPDPLPESMLRQLASAKFLGLFREEERKDEPVTGPSDFTEEFGPGSVAQSDAPPSEPTPTASAPDADPDLRLQQDHAPPGDEPGRGTG
jgi:hypothetical protein